MIGKAASTLFTSGHVGDPGDSWMEGVLGNIQKVFPGRGCGLPFFSEEAAHLLLAASDYLLLPSRFEPCGLVALYGLRYGAVPIVTPAGGLRDIVTSQACCGPISLTLCPLH